MRGVKTVRSGTVYVADFCDRETATGYAELCAPNAKIKASEAEQGLGTLEISLKDLNAANDFLVFKMVKSIEPPSYDSEDTGKRINDPQEIEDYLRKIDRNDFDILIKACNEVYTDGGKKK